MSTEARIPLTCLVCALSAVGMLPVLLAASAAAQGGPENGGQEVRGPRVEVEPVIGLPTFTIDGKPFTIPCFETYRPEEKYFRQFAEAGVKVHSFNTNAAACDYGHSTPTWLGPDEWDYSGFEERCERVLAADPDALIMPRINLGTPLWWLEANPDELEVLHHGSTLYNDPNRNPTLPKNRPFPSIVSKKWRSDMGMALAKFLKHVNDSKYGPHIFGYILAGLDTEEWYHWSSGSDQLAGYSPLTQGAFRDWLRAKYGSDEALQRAWNDPAATLAAADIPARDQRVGKGDETLRDPATEMNVIDFYLFYNQIVPDTIQHFSDIARRETGGKKALGAFYGYMYEFRGDPEYGHNALEQFNAIDSLDFIFVTASYMNRQSGTGGDYSRSPAFSLRLHDKLWYHDNDVCSFLAPQVLAGVGMNEEGDWSKSLKHHLDVLGYTDSAEKTKWMYRRSLGFAICTGAYESYFDLHGGYYDHPELMTEVALLNRIADQSKHEDRRSNSEILVLSDETSCSYTGFRSLMLEQSLLDTQHELIKVGAPADHVLLADLHLVDTEPYKLVVFLNCYHMTDAQRRTVADKLMRDGKHLLWCYAPGLFKGNAASSAWMEELTGMKITPHEDGAMAAPRIRLAQRIPAFQDVPKTFGPEAPSCRPFFVEDAQVLGTLASAPDRAVFARKEMDGWTSLYAITPALPAALYRALAKQAGVHIYNDADDTFYANVSYAVLHANGEGERTIRLPQKYDVYDEAAQAQVAAGVSSYTRSYAHGETVILRLEPAQPEE